MLALALTFARGATTPTLATTAISIAGAHPQHPAELLGIGRRAYQDQRTDDAIAAWQAAAQGFGQRGDRLQKALTLSYLSMVYQGQGAWPEAEALVAQSLTQLRQWRSSGPDQSLQALTIQGQVLNTQGALQFSQGDLTAALESWQQSERFYRQANDIQRLTGSLINQARALQALGYFLRARTLLDQAQTQLEQADPALRVIGFQSLGDTRRAIGDLGAAKVAYSQGLAAAETQSLPRETAALLLSLGQLEQRQQQPDEALSLYRRAENIAPDPLQQAQARVNEFDLLLKTGAWESALALSQSLPAQLKALPPSRASLYTQTNFAQHLMASQGPGVVGQAANLLGTTVQQARALGDRYAEAYATGYLGQAYELTQQWPSAKALTEDALLIAQSLNATDMAYQWQWQLGRVLKAQDNSDGAIAAYKTAFQSLQSLRYDLATIAPDEQFSFRKSVEPVYREYVDLLLQSPENDPASLQQARQVIESLKVAELNDYFRSACIEGQVVALDRVDQASAAVIYPIMLTDRLEVIVSLPNRPLQHHSVPVARGQVEATLKELQQNLARPFVTPASKRLGEAVYSWLVRPIEADLRFSEVSTLTFVLDGVLRSVPMAALFDGDRYLIEDYSIALTPGLQLIAPKPLRRQGLETLAVGLTEARHGFGALSNVDLELAQVEATVPSRVLLNQSFTSEALRQQVEALPYPVVHLATHGQFSSRVEETFILAWDRPISMNELSAILKAGELTRQTPIELLILSACETATGDERAALGLAGLAVQAGARSTIASLWSLDDESGAVLIGHLYDGLAKADISKAEALRKAQLALLNSPNYRAPLFWAPFVLVGNWL
ncbi:MAG: CHAT domain-containing protein [Cyanobacteria bacterium P01_A01_bin.135]